MLCRYRYTVIYFYQLVYFLLGVKDNLWEIRCPLVSDILIFFTWTCNVIYIDSETCVNRTPSGLEYLFSIDRLKYLDQIWCFVNTGFHISWRSVKADFTVPVWRHLSIFNFCKYCNTLNLVEIQYVSIYWRVKETQGQHIRWFNII